jgi:hypothetical protein
MDISMKMYQSSKEGALQVGEYWEEGKISDQLLNEHFRTPCKFRDFEKD